MSNYFSNFPLIKYNGIVSRDIVRRTNFIENNFSAPYLFLPYTVKQGEKPEDIAQYYYGSVAYTWAVLMANNIFDPLTDWHLTDPQLNRYIMKKYETESGTTGFGVLEWTQNQTIDENIVFYYDDVEDLKISVDSFENVDNPMDYRAIRLYEYEVAVNDAKRDIRLIEKSNIARVEKDLVRLINK